MSPEQLQKLKPAPFFVIPGLATERGQTTIRLLWALALALYLYLHGQFEGSLQHVALGVVSAIHFVSAGVAEYLVRTNYENIHLRRAIPLVLDQALLAAVLYVTGEVAAPIVLMPLLLTFGSGLRYGRTYAVYSSILSSILTCAVLLSSPYWTQYPAIQVGLALATILFPVYVFRLTDTLALQLRTDSLTGLRNRVGFNELLDDVVLGASTSEHGSALVFLDLDGFKQVNDVKGHPVGDLVLKHVAYWLSTELSALGMPARFAGDEFAVIIGKLDTEERLEAALTRFLKRTTDVGQLFNSPLGASIGVYYIEPGATTTARFVSKAADELMYKAKASGRNQFITSTSRAFTNEGKLVESTTLPLAVEEIVN
jgi:diguanylate cyclase (GGDEF)-like protein